jgi:ribonuclease Z
VCSSDLSLPARKLLRVSDVFVTHAHMDHFFGFDWLLRVCLGRERPLRLYGPPGFIAQVDAKIRAYTWNLVARYEKDFTLEATEMSPDGRARAARFRCHATFECEDEREWTLVDGVLLDEPSFRVRAAFLEHGIHCLGFALEEAPHVNIRKEALEQLGFPPGEWLRELKQAAVSGASGALPFRIWWTEEGTIHERSLPLSELTTRLLDIAPGCKLAYVTDIVYNDTNASRVAALAADADVLFIEAPFLDSEAHLAAQKCHLTARQAGMLARLAGVKTVTPFHFSPRYSERESELREEIAAAFAGDAGD